MKKTTVYLDDDQADGLRQLAAATGRPQAELIREAVARLLRRRVRRPFHSLGTGEGPGDHPRWNPEELHAARIRPGDARP